MTAFRGRRGTRPLVKDKDPLEVLEAQALERYEAYGEADIIVETGETAHNVAVDAIIKALTALAARNPS